MSRPTPTTAANSGNPGPDQAEGAWPTEQAALEAFAAWETEFREQSAGFLTSAGLMAQLSEVA